MGRETDYVHHRKPSHSPDRLAHGIIIPPAIEHGWLDTLLREQRGDLRTMIDGVVNGLDHYDDGLSVIGPSVKMEDLTQVPLLRDGDQLFS